MKKKIIFVVVAVCLLVFVSVVAFSQSKTVDKWEYVSIRYKDDAGLNAMGNEGWELIQLLEYNPSGKLVTGYNCVFKRKLP
jgi:uncharacterized protein YxeA